MTQPGQQEVLSREASDDPVELAAEDFYGKDLLAELRQAQADLDEAVERFVREHEDDDDLKPVVYHTSRIKSPESLRGKLRRLGLEETIEAALDAEVHDIVGERVVCAFNDDVYRVADWFESQEGYEIARRKDYIAYPKPNGYRSLHLILRVRQGAFEGRLEEVQLRSISMDFWSTLEHKMKYKKQVGNERLMRDELKRCADEIASIDLSMAAIRDMIRSE